MFNHQRNNESEQIKFKNQIRWFEQMSRGYLISIFADYIFPEDEMHLPKDFLVDNKTVIISSSSDFHFS